MTKLYYIPPGHNNHKNTLNIDKTANAMYKLKSRIKIAVSLLYAATTYIDNYIKTYLTFMDSINFKANLLLFYGVNSWFDTGRRRGCLPVRRRIARMILVRKYSLKGITSAIGSLRPGCHIRINHFIHDDPANRLARLVRS